MWDKFLIDRMLWNMLIWAISVSEALSWKVKQCFFLLGTKSDPQNPQIECQLKSPSSIHNFRTIDGVLPTKTLLNQEFSTSLSKNKTAKSGWIKLWICLEMKCSAIVRSFLLEKIKQPAHEWFSFASQAYSTIFKAQSIFNFLYDAQISSWKTEALQGNWGICSIVSLPKAWNSFY